MGGGGMTTGLRALTCLGLQVGRSVGSASPVSARPLCRAFDGGRKAWSLGVSSTMSHYVALSFVAFFLVRGAAVAAWEPRGLGHVAGGVRRGGSVVPHRRQWRLLVLSLGLMLAVADHDLTLTLNRIYPGLKK